MVYTVTWEAKSKDNDTRGALDFDTSKEALDFTALFDERAVKVSIIWQEAE